MDVQKEIILRNAISYCIENNDVNTATNRIMEFIRDEKEALTLTDASDTLILTPKDAELFFNKVMNPKEANEDLRELKQAVRALETNNVFKLK